MPQRKAPPPPSKSGEPREPRSILVLDRFSEASLRQWKTLSEEPEKLDPVARVLGRIKLPERAGKLKRRLQMPQNALYMTRSGKQLFEVVFSHNWRRLPVQFDLPAPGQVLAEIVRDAGYEGILYRSTRYTGLCLAVFPEMLAEGSFIELVDKPPHSETVVRLDESTADLLSGWEVLPTRARSHRR